MTNKIQIIDRNFMNTQNMSLKRGSFLMAPSCQPFRRSMMASATASSVPSVERSSPDPISPPISARMISVRFIFAFVFVLISRHSRSRKSTWSGGRMTVNLFSTDVSVAGRTARIGGTFGAGPFVPSVFLKILSVFPSLDFPFVMPAFLSFQ